MGTIIFRGRREELERRLAQLGPFLAGQIPDPQGVARDVLTAIGLALLGKIQEAFDIKSQGGRDAMGVQWAPLSPVTLSLRRKGATGTAATAKLAAAFSSLPAHRKKLIERQYQALRDLYRAKSHGAAARAHARSLLEKIRPFIPGGRYQRLHRELHHPMTEGKERQVALAGAYALILRDTNRMFQSLSPQVNAPKQVLRIGPGAVSVGSNDEKFKFHQSDRPRRLKKDGTPRLPRRQILPDKNTPMPEPWKRAAAEALARALQNPNFWLRFLGEKAHV